MDNQHRKIAGYRELSQTEIDLMNRIKAKGAELLELQAELVDLLKLHELSKINAIDGAQTSDAEAEAKACYAEARSGYRDHKECEALP